MPEAMVLIQQNSRQYNYRDDIMKGTGRVWPKPGDAVFVPESQKWAYLAHSHFKEISQDEYDAFKAQSSDEVVQPIVSQMIGLPLVALEKIAASVADLIAATKAKPKIDTKPSDRGTASAYSVRVKKIAAAIRDIDLDDSEKACLGVPLPRAINEQCGIDASQDEIRSAMTFLGHAVPPHDELKAKAKGIIPEAAKPGLLVIAESFGVEVSDKRIGVEKLRSELESALA